MKRTILGLVFLAACGGGSSSSQPKEPVAEEAPPPDDDGAIENVATTDHEDVAGPSGGPSTGSHECDALIARTLCLYDKNEAQIPTEARKAFEDSIGAWREALANDATRQATIDACKMSLDAANDGFASMGC